jgi:hypothetical protein
MMRSGTSFSQHCCIDHASFLDHSYNHFLFKFTNAFYSYRLYSTTQHHLEIHFNLKSHLNAFKNFKMILNGKLYTLDRQSHPHTIKSWMKSSSVQSRWVLINLFFRRIRRIQNQYQRRIYWG